MTNVALLGKEYVDHLFCLEKFKQGETNNCTDFSIYNGGVYNLLLPDDIDNIHFNIYTSGLKRAYIISDKETSKRTAVTVHEEDSSYKQETMKDIETNNDWLHISYIDDIEDFKKITNIQRPKSIDFCTDNPREKYLSALINADIVFDSRERRHLYDGLTFSTPVIFHDENGIEIVKGGNILHEASMIPTMGLNVNGAGDAYAAYFIKNYNKHDIISSATMAMSLTTDFLIRRAR